MNRCHILYAIYLFYISILSIYSIYLFYLSILYMPFGWRNSVKISPEAGAILTKHMYTVRSGYDWADAEGEPLAFIAPNLICPGVPALPIGLFALQCNALFHM
jgi:hypothetical protein